MSRGFIITGTDTGIGKTIFAAALTGALMGSYWKPVQAGLDEGGDTAIVKRLSGLAAQHILPEVYRLTTACSPHRAAEIDGITIDLERLTLPRSEHLLVIEGAGGALVPLNRKMVFADLFAQWQLPVVIVARTALGTINHSLLTVEALRARGIEPFGVAFVGEANADSEATIAAIGRIRRLGRLDWIDPLNAETLAAGFAQGFDTKDFGTEGSGK